MKLLQLQIIIMPETYYLTVFLAQLMGVFSLIIGLSMLVRSKLMMQMLEDFFDSRALVYILGVLEVLGGLMLVLSHNVWDNMLAAFVTTLGWLILIEGIFYLVASRRIIENVYGVLRSSRAYYLILLVYLGIGAYLTYAGFILS